MPNDDLQTPGAEEEPTGEEIRQALMFNDELAFVAENGKLGTGIKPLILIQPLFGNFYRFVSTDEGDKIYLL